MDIPCTEHSDTNQEEVILSLCQVISSFSILHPEDVTEVILQNPLSCFGVRHVLWRSVAKNPPTANRVLRVLLQQINKELDRGRYDSAVAPKHRYLVSVMAMSAICELLNALDETSVDADILSQLLCALIRLISRTMRRIGRTDVGENSPCGMAVNTIKTIFKRQKDFTNVKTMERFELMKDEQTHPAGVIALSKYMVSSGSGHIGEVIRSLLPLLETSHQMHFLTSTAFFSELLYYPGVMDKKKTKKVIKAMMRNSIHPDPVIRFLSLRALGNAANGAHKLIRKYKHPILRLFVDSMCDIPFVTTVDGEFLKAAEMFVRLLTRREMGEQFYGMIAFCRWFLNNGKQSIQINSMLLLGELARKCQDNFTESVVKLFKTCLTSLLMKLQSKDVETVSASMFCLYYCLPIVGCGDLQTLLQGQNMARGDDMHLKSIFKTLVEQHSKLARFLVLRSRNLLLHHPLLSEAIRQIGFLVGFMNRKDLLKLNTEFRIDDLINEMAELSQNPCNNVGKAAMCTKKVLKFQWTYAQGRGGNSLMMSYPSQDSTT